MVQSEKFRSLASYAHCAFQEILSSFDDREMADEWKMYIPPAVAWIMIGGEVLHDLCSKREPSAWNQSAIFTPERWQLWKDRFLELADQTDIDEHCQNLSKEAAEEMDRIEQRAWIYVARLSSSNEAMSSRSQRLSKWITRLCCNISQASIVKSSLCSSSNFPLAPPTDDLFSESAAPSALSLRNLFSILTGFSPFL
jgi:hypothetical protein